nr:hypothetical protein Iba_scaffold7513CG0080 [Ipomoea batatas]
MHLKLFIRYIQQRFLNQNLHSNIRLETKTIQLSPNILCPLSLVEASNIQEYLLFQIVKCIETEFKFAYDIRESACVIHNLERNLFEFFGWRAILEGEFIEELRRRFSSQEINIVDRIYAIAAAFEALADLVKHSSGNGGFPNPSHAPNSDYAHIVAGPCG